MDSLTIAYRLAQYAQIVCTEPVAIKMAEVYTKNPYPIRSLEDVDTFLEMCNFPRNSLKQYHTQIVKIKEMFKFIYDGTPLPVHNLELLNKNQKTIFANNLLLFKEYIENDFKTDMGNTPSKETIRAFINTLLIVGQFAELTSFYTVEVLNGGFYVINFPYAEVKEYALKFQQDINDRAYNQVSFVPSQEDFYHRVIEVYKDDLKKQAVLLLYCYTPLRDDGPFRIVNVPEEQPGKSPLEIADHYAKKWKENFFIWFGPEKIYLVLHNTKTIRNPISKRVIPIHPHAAKALNNYLDWIGYWSNKKNKFPLGSVKDGQNISRWTKRLGLFVLTRYGDKVDTRGIGINELRRINQAVGDASEDPEKRLEINLNLGHSSVTAMKYKSTIISIPDSLLMQSEYAPPTD